MKLEVYKWICFNRILFASNRKYEKSSFFSHWFTKLHMKMCKLLIDWVENHCKYLYDMIEWHEMLNKDYNNIERYLKVWMWCFSYLSFVLKMVWMINFSILQAYKNMNVVWLMTCSFANFLLYVLAVGSWLVREIMYVWCAFMSFWFREVLSWIEVWIETYFGCFEWKFEPLLVFVVV